MRLLSGTKALIIGLALLGLSGCSALRLGYDNAPTLAWWWADGYVDFSREQAPQARRAIDQWFAWHRSTQLPDYAVLLLNVAAQITEPTTPEQVCRWQAQARDRLEPGLDRGLVHAAELLPGLGETQWRHLEQHYAKGNASAREDFAQPQPAERLKAAVKRTVERFESVYGRLEEPQRRVIAAGVAASPFNPEAWLVERQRRQRETLQTLRRLAAERADRDQRIAALRALAERTERSPLPAYRAYQQRLAEHNCVFVAQVHNASTAAQRLVARDKLRGWEEDLRALAAAATPVQQASVP